MVAVVVAVYFDVVDGVIVDVVVAIKDYDAYYANCCCCCGGCCCGCGCG